MSDLFGITPEKGENSHQNEDSRPLSEILRPKNLGEVIGQDHLLGENAPIGQMLAKKRLSSMILWGPPGVGKTTIARLLAQETGHEFQQISAVFSGVADLKKAFERAQTYQKMGKNTLLFIDEIHRFNRAQQDGFLPYVESGVVTLVGATTENPSFELNGALLSRARVFVLNALDEAALNLLIDRTEAHFGHENVLNDDARAAISKLCDGDGRYLLNLLGEIFAIRTDSQAIDAATIMSFAQRKAPAYDKNKEEHYNLISALHKSVRASDPDAALYWLARMLHGGEDPMFIARRLIRMASEDIGLAEPNALAVTIAARDAFQMLGKPEGELALAQAVLHLSCCPKSNAAYTAFGAAQELARITQDKPPPKHFLNAPTDLMKTLGYGDNYQYDPDVAGGVSGQSGFPDDMAQARLYEPKDSGAEARIIEKLAVWRELRKSSP